MVMRIIHTFDVTCRYPILKEYLELLITDQYAMEIAFCRGCTSKKQLVAI